MVRLDLEGPVTQRPTLGNCVEHAAIVIELRGSLSDVLYKPPSRLREGVDGLDSNRSPSVSHVPHQ